MMPPLFQSEWTYPEYILTNRTGEAASKLALTLIGFVAIGVVIILAATDGNILAAVAFMGGFTILFATCYRLDWGLYLLIGMVLVFDQFEIPGYEPWTYKVYYFRNLKEIPYFPVFEAAVVNPLELQILLLLFVWFVVLCFKHRRLTLYPVITWQSALVFFLAIIGALVYGLRRGGDFLPALWEVRALFYMGLLFAFVPQVVRRKEQVHTLMWVIIAAVVLKASQGFGRLALLGFTFGGRDVLTNHEDPVFILNIIVFLFALVVFGARTPQRTVLMLLLFVLVMGFFSGQRRAAYAAILPTVAAFMVALPKGEQRFFLRAIVPVVLVLGIYCVVFWNSESKLASPVRLIKTGLSTDPEEAGDRYHSNLYRDIEKYNLATTIRDYPVVGIGFGNKYDQRLPLARISFPLRDYIPHNEVLWLMCKTGVVGFCIFWLFVNSYAANASHTIARLADPYLKAVSVVAVAAIANQVVVSYFDLQLTYYRNMVFLGTMMGLQSACKNIEADQPGQKNDEELE